MKLSIKLLDQDTALNNLIFISDISLHRGETTEVVIQLMQNGQRYIPTDGAIVSIAIPRSTQAIPKNWNERESIDHSLIRQAEIKFVDDKSIWSIPLTSVETKTLISGAIVVTVSEGEKIRKAQVNQAIRIIDGQER